MKRSFAVLAPVAVVLALGFGAARLAADDDTKAPAAAPAMSKEDKVRKLLELQGGEKLAQLTLNKILAQFDSMPGLPPGFSEKFKAKANTKELMELALPSYVKHADDAMLDAAIAFFSSEQGRKLAAQMPVITMESMDAGAAWGQKIGAEVVRELAEEEQK